MAEWFNCPGYFPHSSVPVPDATGKINDLSISVSGGNLVVSDVNEQFSGVPITTPPSTLSGGNKTLTIPLSAITGRIIVNAGGGNDSLTLDLSGGDPIPAGNLFFNGGDPTSGTGDKLVITGGNQGTVTYSYTNAHDGSVVMSNFGTVNYTGLEPISNDGTATDVVVNLPSGPNTISLADDGNLGNTLSRLSGPTIETTDFTNPGGSLTINRGNATDTLSIGALPDFNANLTIGAAGSEFSTVTFNGAVTLASGNSLSASVSGTISLPNSTSDLSTSGAGTISLTTARNISLSSGSSVATVDGNLTLSANQQTTATTGNFNGILASGALIKVTGSGELKLIGRGGDDGGGLQHGIKIDLATSLIGGTGLVTVHGTGGSTGAAGAGANFGVFINGAGSQISSTGGAVNVTGEAGASGAGDSNYGIELNSGAQITAGGSGAVTVDGTGGAGSGGSNVGVLISSTNSMITSGGGEVSVTGHGTGAPGGIGGNYGVWVLLGGQISAGGIATVTVNGTGGSTGAGGGGVNVGVYISNTDSQITSSGGEVNVTGTGGDGASSFAIRLQASGSINTASNATLTLIGDSMDSDGTAVISSGAGTTIIKPLTASLATDLGGADSPAQLGLTNDELGEIAAGTIVIGDTTAYGGTVTVSSPINITPALSLKWLSSATTTLNVNAALVLITTFTATGLDNANLNANIIAGISGDATTVTVDDNPSGQIQDGIDIAASGATVNIKSGTYAENASTSAKAITLSPGSSPGVVHVNNLTLDGDDTLAMEISGTNPATPDFDQFIVSGAVALGNSTLALSGSYAPVAGNSFTIVSGAISNIFSGHAEGSLYTLNSVPLTIHYAANAVTLAFAGDTNPPTSTIGFPVDGNIYNASSWASGAPIAGTASDDLSGVQKVEVSVMQVSTGKYWNGSAFASGTEFFLTATGTTIWSQAFAAANFTTDGTYAVHSRATDNANNVESSPTVTFTYDNTAPTGAITVSDSVISDADVPGPFTVKVTYSEAMNPAFTPAIAFTPAVAGTLNFTSSAWSVGNTVYTASYAETDANVLVPAVTIDVTGGRDLAGNTQTTSSLPSAFAVDTQNPTVTVNVVAASLNDTSNSSNVTFIFSEAVTGFDASDLTPVGGALSGFTTLDSSHYSATFTATDGIETTGSVSVGNGYTDLVGNTGATGSDTVSIDTKDPTVTVNIVSAALTNASNSSTVNFVFSEAVTHFDASDLTPVGGTLSGFANTDSSHYSATFTATDGIETTGSVTVGNGYTDLVGNTGTTGSDAISIDTKNPTGTITVSDLVIIDADLPGPFTVKVTYSEAMNTAATPTIVFTPSVAGTLSFTSGAWSAGNTVYTAGYTESDANVTIPSVQVDVTGGKDVAGNAQIASSLASAFAVNTQGVIVVTNNPTVTASEGSQATNGGSYSNPAGNSVSISASAGVITRTGTTSGTWSWSVTPADGPLSQPVTINFTDTVTSATTLCQFTLNVNNVPPTIAISGNAHTQEGSIYFLTLGTITDPGIDTVTQWAVHWGDGQTSVYPSGGLKSHIFQDGPAAVAITVDLTDEDGTFTNRANPLTVTVDNVVPTIALAGNANVNEGSSYSLTLGAISDPGTDTVTGYTVHWGDGATSGPFVGNPTGQVLTRTYSDGTTAPTISVDLTDEDGLEPNAGAKTISVSNVAPTIAISGAATVAEGSPYGLTLGAITDPGPDTVAQWIVHWGDGQTSTFTSGGVQTHAYADGPAGPFNITVDLVDEDGTFTNRANALAVSVTNVAPTIALSGNATANEGTPYSLTLGPVTDPGTDTVTSYTIHWGDGTNTGPVSGNPNGQIVTHTYTDGPVNRTITVDLVDEDGTFLVAGTKTITVNNVTPTIALSGNATVAEGAAYSLTLGAITDPAPDTVTGYTIHWGDGANTGPISGNPTGQVVTHTYANGPTSPTITVDLVDEDGTALAAGTKSITVTNAVPTLSVLSGPTTANFASTRHYIFSITDPGTVDSFSVASSSGGTQATLSNFAIDNITRTGSFDATFTGGSGSTTLSLQVKDQDGGLSNISTLSVSLLNVFQVTSFQSTPSGFDVTFNRSPVLPDLNLYDGVDLPDDLPDVVLHAVGANSDVQGSLVWNGATNTLSFVKSGGILAADNYNVSLRSGAGGFHDASGHFLDGNGDLNDTQANDNFVTSFSVASSTARVLSIKDFARGPGQVVNEAPLVGTSRLSVTIDNSASMRSLAFTLQYDPGLLHVASAALAGGLPADWTISVNSSALSSLVVTASGTTQLTGSNVSIVQITADVPATAPYGALEALRLTGLTVNIQSGASIVATPSVADIAVHKVAYLGDADGNGVYTGNDVALISRVVTGIDTGFDIHGWTDPVIVADVDASGSLTGADVALVAQKSVSLPTPQIPDLPGILLVSNGGGSLASDEAPKMAHATAVSNPSRAVWLVGDAAPVFSTMPSGVNSMASAPALDPAEPGRRNSQGRLAGQRLIFVAPWNSSISNSKPAGRFVSTDDALGAAMVSAKGPLRTTVPTSSIDDYFDHDQGEAAQNVWPPVNSKTNGSGMDDAIDGCFEDLLEDELLMPTH